VNYYLVRGQLNTLYQASCGRPYCPNVSQTFHLSRKEVHRELKLEGWRKTTWKNSMGFDTERLVCPKCASRTDDEPLLDIAALK
jgi:hypothetical protein